MMSCNVHNARREAVREAADRARQARIATEAYIQRRFDEKRHEARDAALRVVKERAA